MCGLEGGKLRVHHKARAALIKLFLACGAFARACGGGSLFLSLHSLDLIAQNQLRADRWPMRPLRIGVCPELAPDLVALNREVEWIAADASLMRSARLDACISRPAPLEVVVECNENPDVPAAENRWDAPASVRYADVFPLRLDFREWRASDENISSQCVNAMAVVSALLARSPARCATTDLLDGRYLPERGLTPYRAGEVLASNRDIVNEAFESLFRIVSDEPTHRGSVTEVAARMLSAWAATDTFMIADSTRLAAANFAATSLANEAAVQLRAAAVNVALGSDSDAVQACIRALQTATRVTTEHAPDDFAHLYAETSLGEADSLTVGRIAAGLVIVLAHQDGSKARFLIEDFMDEARTIFVGRDQDTARLTLIVGALFDHLGLVQRPATIENTLAPSESVTESITPKVKKPRKSRRKAA
jgi:hypothetical protein